MAYHGKVLVRRYTGRCLLTPDGSGTRNALPRIGQRVWSSGPTEMICSGGFTNNNTKDADDAVAITGAPSKPMGQKRNNAAVGYPIHESDSHEDEETGSLGL